MMLENPYYAAPSSGPEDAGAYQGAGRIEESEDGSSISLWWESTLEESFAAQMRMQEKLGALKQIRRLQIIFIMLSLAMFFLSWVSWRANGDAGVFFLVGGGTLICLSLLRPYSFKRAIRKIVVKMRGTSGTIEMNAIVEPRGVHAAWSDLEVIYYWRGIREVEVSKHGITFLRERDGLLHIPTRIFPSSDRFDRFVTLAQKYSQVQPG